MLPPVEVTNKRCIRRLPQTSNQSREKTGVTLLLQAGEISGAGPG